MKRRIKQLIEFMESKGKRIDENIMKPETEQVKKLDLIVNNPS